MSEIIIQFLLFFNAAKTTVWDENSQLVWPQLMSSSMTSTYNEVINNNVRPDDTNFMVQSYEKTKDFMEQEVFQLRKDFDFLVASSADPICSVKIPEAYYTGDYDKQKKI
jgi:hypothetical protein